MSMLPEDAATGYAIPAADLLADFLIENDANDPDAGDPAGWPAWTDCDPQWALGPDPGTGLVLDVLDLVPLPGDEPYEPTLEDLLDYEDWLERLEYERRFHINARFV